MGNQSTTLTPQSPSPETFEHFSSVCRTTISSRCNEKKEEVCTASSIPVTPSSHDTFVNVDRALISSAHNGVIGKYLSKRLISVATTFWYQNIQSIGTKDKLEIGCSIYFSMLSSNKEAMKKLRQRNLSSDTKLETTSLKYLEMIGWLLRNMTNTSVDVYSLLTQLGILHQKMGITRNYFNIMIKSLHETMIYYFPKQYNINVQYAMEEIITLASRIMMGENNIETSNHSKRRYCNRRTKVFHGANTVFLQSLEECLLSEIGREYFYRYLDQNWCSELTVYLELIKKFKNQTSDKQRYIVAKDLIKKCICTNGEFAINISYETRTDLLDSFEKLNETWMTSQMPIGYFKNVEMEIRRLIIKNHWSQFVRNVYELHNSSNIDYLVNQL